MTTKTLTPAEVAERDTYLRRLNSCAPYIRTVRDHEKRAEMTKMFAMTVLAAVKEWGRLPADAVKWP
jgi:hypothetical protein